MLRYLTKLMMVVAASFFVVAAHATTDDSRVNAELAAASRSILGGHVKDGFDRLASLLRQLDPAKDKDAYWRVSATLVEGLSQVEDHASASKVLETLIVTKIPEGHPVYFPWMQFYTGRNLAYTGKADEGEKLLRALAAHNARMVYTPAQRAAALVLSQIELDRGNVSQSALWMRRAVIATLVDKGAASEEIVDCLTRDAVFLMNTRRSADAHNLFVRLAQIYENSFAHQGSKYIKFVASFTDMQAELGNNIEVTDRLLKGLHDVVAATDIVPISARATLFYQDLYQLARSTAPNKNDLLKERIDQTISAYPDFSRQLRNRVILAYFALVSDNTDLAEHILNADTPATNADSQYTAYETELRSLIAARRNELDKSIALSRDGLNKLARYHDTFENESASHLPAISIPERISLATILALDAAHVATFGQADALFQLGQFLNRDKGKLGLNKNVARAAERSDLRREEMRSRDRLRELRDQLMNEATDGLLARALPVRPYTLSKNNDYSLGSSGNRVGDFEGS